MRLVIGALIGLLLAVPAVAGPAPSLWQTFGAASLGDVAAEISLGTAYLHGQGLAANRIAAFQWIERAARQGSAEAETDVADMLFDGIGHLADRGAATGWLLDAAEQDYGPAQDRMGDIYFYGYNGAVDRSKAIPFYKAAADKHLVLAEINLARIYQCTCDLGKQTEALALLRDAASQGAPFAYTKLGETYSYGLGVPVDLATAFDWFSKAAAKNQPEGLYRLGQSYENGWGVTADAQKSLSADLKASDLGYVEASFRAGMFYERGIGVPKDLNEAERLYRIAAEAGVADAEMTIGSLYLYGKIAGHTQADATAWLERAGRDGRGDAYVILAEWFSSARDEDRAYDYAVLATQSRDPQAVQDGEAMEQVIMSVKRRAGLELPPDPPPPAAPLG